MPEPSTLTCPTRRRARRLHARPCGLCPERARAFGTHFPSVARGAARSSGGLRARLLAPCGTGVRRIFAVEERA